MYIPPKVKPLCPPEKKPRFEDVPYAKVTLDNGESYTLKMDIYQNPNQTEPGPCIIYIFGGGWCWGEYKQVTQKAVYCRDLVRLTEEGYTIICPDYRLVHQSLLPACIYDVKGCVRFLKAHGAEYNIDPNRIGAMGNSAGGHLTSMLALSANVPEMEGDVGGNLEFDSSIQAACVFYGPASLVDSVLDNAVQADNAPELTGTEIEHLSNDNAYNIPAVGVGYTGEGKSIQTLAELIQSGDTSHPDWHYVELLQKISPVNYVREDAPPMCFFHGGHDPIVNPHETDKLYQALTKVGADVTMIQYSYGGHGPSLGDQVDRFAYEFLKARI